MAHHRILLCAIVAICQSSERVAAQRSSKTIRQFLETISVVPTPKDESREAAARENPFLYSFNAAGGVVVQSGQAAVAQMTDSSTLSTLPSDPTLSPTSSFPTLSPITSDPTWYPVTLDPTQSPTTLDPTLSPTTLDPTMYPTTLDPTMYPTTLDPTTLYPTMNPTTLDPTMNPTTLDPTMYPTTLDPTMYPTTLDPTLSPNTLEPTLLPTVPPSPTHPPFTKIDVVQTALSLPLIYPDAVIPDNAEDNGYFNYDPYDEQFGPGLPAYVPYIVNETFTYNRKIYKNNGWIHVKNTHEFDYWKETLKDEALHVVSNQVPNQCDSRYQSPVNVWANGAKCFEFHEIRSLPGDFAMDEHSFIKKEILPNKLRFKYWRRPPGTLEPDPPSVDLPYGWKISDILHLDVRIPSEHLIEGKRYPAEYQAWYYNKERKRIVAIAIMMDTHPDDTPNAHWEKALVEMEVKYIADQLECHEHQRRKLKAEEQWLRRMKNFVKTGIDSAYFNIIGDGKLKVSDVRTEVSNGYSTLLEEPDHIEKSFQALRKMTTDRSENSLFDGKYPNYIPPNKLKEADQSQNKVYPAHLRRRQISEIIPPKANPDRWDPLHDELKRSPYFYGYYGSLTEPPCSEIVSWRIIDKPALISKKQLQRMKNVLFNHVDGNCHRTSSHYKSTAVRPIQDQMGRPIWHCTSEDFLPDP